MVGYFHSNIESLCLSGALFLIHWQLIQGYRQLLSNLLKHLGVKLPGTTWWCASSFLGKVTETAAVLPTSSQIATLWQKPMY